MKTSEIYKLAQHAVLRDASLTNTNKLEIIRELQDREETALYIEKKKEQEKQKDEQCSR